MAAIPAAGALLCIVVIGLVANVGHSQVPTRSNSASPKLQDFSWSNGFKGTWPKQIKENLLQFKNDCSLLYAEWEKSSLRVNIGSGKGDQKLAFVGQLTKPAMVANCIPAPMLKGDTRKTEQLRDLTLNWTGINMVYGKDRDRQTFILTSLTLKLDSAISVLHGSWNITKATLLMEGPSQYIPNGRVNLPISTSVMTAAYDLQRPARDKFSFSCNDLKLKSYPFQSNGDPLEPATTLRLTRFQLQPFTVEGKQFRQSFDCSTWFTIPLWMGFFTVVGFAIIVLLGTYLLSTISVMDRFEDPKGKPLQIKAD